MITKAFLPREKIFADGSTRTEAVLLRIMAMSDGDVGTTLRRAGTEARVLSQLPDRFEVAELERAIEALDGDRIVDDQRMSPLDRRFTCWRCDSMAAHPKPGARVAIAA